MKMMDEDDLRPSLKNNSFVIDFASDGERSDSSDCDARRLAMLRISTLVDGSMPTADAFSFTMKTLSSSSVFEEDNLSGKEVADILAAEKYRSGWWRVMILRRLLLLLAIPVVVVVDDDVGSNALENECAVGM